MVLGNDGLLNRLLSIRHSSFLVKTHQTSFQKYRKQRLVTGP